MFDLTINGTVCTVQDDDIVIRGALLIDSKGKKIELGKENTICSLVPIRILLELPCSDAEW